MSIVELAWLSLIDLEDTFWENNSICVVYVNPILYCNRYWRSTVDCFLDGDQFFVHYRFSINLHVFVLREYEVLVS